MRRVHKGIIDAMVLDDGMHVANSNLAVSYKVAYISLKKKKPKWQLTSKMLLHLFMYRDINYHNAYSFFQKEVCSGMDRLRKRIILPPPAIHKFKRTI